MRPRTVGLGVKTLGRFQLLAALGIGTGALLVAPASCSSCASTPAPDASDPCVVYESALEKLAGMAQLYPQVPSMTDPRAQTYYVQAAHLAQLQRALNIELGVQQALNVVLSDASFDAPGSADAAAAMSQASLAHAADLQSQIDSLVAAADSAGLPLRDADGGVISGDRVMTVTYWRSIGAQAQSALDACAGKDSGVPRQAVGALAETAVLISQADLHGLVESTQIRRLLGDAGL